MVPQGQGDLPDYPRAHTPPSPSPTGREVKGPSLPTGPSAASHGRPGSCHCPLVPGLVRGTFHQLPACVLASPASPVTVAMAGTFWSTHPRVSHLCSKHGSSSDGLPLNPPCPLLSPVHALPFSIHLCPLPSGLPRYPEGLTDAHSFRNEFVLRHTCGGSL